MAEFSCYVRQFHSKAFHESLDEELCIHVYKNY